MADPKIDIEIKLLNFDSELLLAAISTFIVRSEKRISVITGLINEKNISENYDTKHGLSDMEIKINVNRIDLFAKNGTTDRLSYCGNICPNDTIHFKDNKIILTNEAITTVITFQ